jgi:hypothetical protein
MHCCKLTLLYILILPNDGLLKAKTCSCWYYIKIYIFYGHVHLFIVY